MALSGPSRIRKRWLVLSLSAFSLCRAGAAASAAEPAPAPAPTAQKKPVVDELHGVKITDDYRWLENFSDPAVRKWNEEQNRHTRAFLDQFPALPAVRARVKELISASSASYFDMYYRPGVLFARKFQPPREQAMLVTLKSPDDPASERLLLDPVQVNPKGTTTIDFHVPSLDGSLVAVSLSDRGTEDGMVYVYEVKTGKKLADVVPRVNGGTAGGSLAWNGDHTGFYYTRYPRGTERAKEDMSFYQQIYFHKLGQKTEEDSYSLGKDFPRIAESVLQTSEDGRHILCTVGNGDGGDYALYLLGPSGKWEQISTFADKVIHGTFGRDGNLYLLSRKDAPRGKLLRLALGPAAGAPALAKAQVVVPESEAVIESVVPTQGALYVVDLLGGVSQVRVFDLMGHARKPVPVRAVSSVGQVVRTRGDEVLYVNKSYVEPPAWYRYAPATGKASRTALFVTSPADFSDTEVVRQFATSKDGTKVPLTILMRKGTKLDGKNPTVLTGYGGFGVSLTPGFGVLRRVWLEQGGITAIANLRGGGEYGEDWHKNGYLTKKQNVFDDFVACARYLIDNKYTSRDKLAIEGGSNGGLLMGAVVTQHPELFRAVVTHVGLYDMLRFELYPNGAFNVTEYGSVKDPQQFKALHAYSPYHHVADRAAYPAVFFLTGENDPRVNPADSRKMVARLQAASASGLPILLRTSASSGHGSSSLSEAIQQTADVDAFLFKELGVAYQPVKSPSQHAAK